MEEQSPSKNFNYLRKMDEITRQAEIELKSLTLISVYDKAEELIQKALKHVSEMEAGQNDRSASSFDPLRSVCAQVEELLDRLNSLVKEFRKLREFLAEFYDDYDEEGGPNYDLNTGEQFFSRRSSSIKDAEKKAAEIVDKNRKDLLAKFNQVKVFIAINDRTSTPPGNDARADDFDYLNAMERYEIELDKESRVIVLRQKIEELEASVDLAVSALENLKNCNSPDFEMMKAEVISLKEAAEECLKNIKGPVKEYERYREKLFELLSEKDHDGTFKRTLSGQEAGVYGQINKLPEIAARLAPVKVFLQSMTSPASNLENKRYRALHDVADVEEEPYAPDETSAEDSERVKDGDLLWKEHQKGPQKFQDQQCLRTQEDQRSLLEDLSRKGGYISSISIENFKGIAERVTIPLKPLTLIFGANSAGKSTILQALLYANEVLNNNNPDPDETQSGLSLGGFKSVVHNHDLGRQIRIGIEYVPSDDGLPCYGWDRDPDLETSFGPTLPAWEDMGFLPLESIYVEFEVDFDQPNGVHINNYNVCLNGERTASITYGIAPGSGAEILAFNLDHLIDPDLAEDYVKTLNDLDDKDTGLAAQKLQQAFENMGPDESPWQRDEGLQFVEWAAQKSFNSLMDKNNRVKVVSRRGVLPDLDHVLPYKIILPGMNEESDGFNMFSVLVFNMLVAGPVELVGEALKSHRYIGPLRTYPPRNYQPQGSSDLSHWADGMAGWDMLYNDVLNGDHWLDRDQFDLLSLRYEFVPHKVTVSRILNDSQLKRDAADGEQYASRGYNPEDSTAEYKIVRMVDSTSGVALEPCDVGTGVSQVIPVVAGAMAPGCSYLSVEQPELHLHPAIQCNLADLFISQMHRYPERTFLLETHSEHLILRLLRRMRQTAAGTVTKELALSPDDVAVLAVESGENGAEIYELEISESGELLTPWPNGFFAERMDEIIGD